MDMKLLSHRSCLFVLLLLTCQLSPLLSSCPPPFHFESGLCLFVNTAQSFNWCSANHQCSSIGGELVNSHSSISMLVHNVTRSDWDHDMWVGLSDLWNERGTSRSGWQRVNGRGDFPLDVLLHNSNQPSGKPGEDCLRRVPTKRTLADDLCTSSYGFICEFVDPLEQASLRRSEFITWQLTEMKLVSSSPDYCYRDVPAVFDSVDCILVATSVGNSRHVLYNSKTKLCRVLLFTDAQVEREIFGVDGWMNFSQFN